MQAQHLTPGMLVDLEGDPYADPDHNNPGLQYEYAVIQHVEPETAECVAVYFDFDVVGFPLAHDVKVIR